MYPGTRASAENATPAQVEAAISGVRLPHTTFAPGTRVEVGDDRYGTWAGEHGTVMAATPALVAMMAKPGAPDLAGTVWVYMDEQAAYHADHPQYARPEPVGFDASELAAL